MRHVALLTCVLFTLISANAQALTKVSVRLKWFHQFQFAGYYAAKEKGFYKDEGLDVTINERDIKTAPYQDVMAGRDTFGISDSSLFYLRLRGKPVVLIAAIYQHSPLVLISLAKKNIVSPIELKGKKIMYQIGVDDAIITALFNTFGMTANDYTPVKHSFKPDALLTDNIDAMSAYLGNQTFYYEKLGKKLNIINPANYGVDLYGDMLFTSEAIMKRDPQLVERFRRASIKGWYYALQHPKEIVDLIYSKYSQKKSKEKLLHEAEHTRRSVVPELIDIGHISQARINFISNIYKQWYPAIRENSLGDFIYSDYLDLATWQYYKHILMMIGILMAAILAYVYYHRRAHMLELHREFIANEQKFKGNILTIINHELRTPLTSIRASTAMLRKLMHDNLDNKSSELIDITERNCQRLANLIDDILNAEKVATNRMEFKYESVDVVQLNKRIVENYQGLLDAEHAQFIVHDKVRKPVEVMLDPGRYEQVLVNLLSNAAKYSNEDTDIEVNLSINETGDFCTEVKDQGAGIPPALYDQLFERFSRLDTPATRKRQGTGLGLYIAREIILAMGGCLTFKSKEGVGTSFFITLPLTDD